MYTAEWMLFQLLLAGCTVGMQAQMLATTLPPASSVSNITDLYVAKFKAHHEGHALPDCIRQPHQPECSCVETLRQCRQERYACNTYLMWYKSLIPGVTREVRDSYENHPLLNTLNTKKGEIRKITQPEEETQNQDQSEADEQAVMEARSAESEEESDNPMAIKLPKDDKKPNGPEVAEALMSNSEACAQYKSEGEFEDCMISVMKIYRPNMDEKQVRDNLKQVWNETSKLDEEEPSTSTTGRFLAPSTLPPPTPRPTDAPGEPLRYWRLQNTLAFSLPPPQPYVEKHCTVLETDEKNDCMTYVNACRDQAHRMKAVVRESRAIKESIKDNPLQPPGWA